MPVFYVELSAELENVKQVTASGLQRLEMFVKCANCGEAQEKSVYIERAVMHPMPGSRGEAHLVMKCKMCERQATCEWIETKKGVKVGEVNKNAEFCQIVAIEFRGMEPVALVVDKCGPWSLVSEADNEMEVEFDGGDFADYDEAGDMSVCITNVQAQFTRG